MKTIFKNLSKYIIRICQKEKAFIFFIIFCISITQWIDLFFIEKLKINKLIKILVSNLCINIFIAFLMGSVLSLIKHKKIQDILKGIFLIIAFVMMLIEIFLLYNYKTLMSSAIINVILETNYQEVSEFISMYIGTYEYLSVLFLVILIVLFYKRLHNMKNIFENRYFRNTTVFMVIIGLVLMTRMICLGKSMDDLIVPRFYHSVLEGIATINEYQEIYKSVNTVADIIENKSKIKNVILILGESTNRDHMGIYGSKLNTTPNLNKRMESGNLFVFRDVISPHSHTSAVVAKIFTFANYESALPWYQSANLITILNSAGYKTCWISNQESSGVWGTTAQIFSDLSQEKIFTHYRDSKSDVAFYDEDILPILDRSLKEESEKNFFIIHLMGTHGEYKKRYPKEYNVFNESDIESKFDTKRKITIAEYDNAVLYNDFIVNEIIKRFEGKETLIIYLSDHGEEVYDNRDYVGHTEDNGSKYMIEIPMIAWGSKGFLERYPEKVQCIKKALDRPYMTDDIIHSILDLLEIKTIDYDSSRSIFSPNFNGKRQRIYHGQDYDNELKNS